MRNVVVTWTCDVCGKEHPSKEDRPEPCPTLLDVIVAPAGQSGRYHCHVQVCRDNFDCHAKGVAVATEKMLQNAKEASSIL